MSTNYTFSRVSSFVLPLKILDSGTKPSKLQLNHTSFKNCSFNNFGLVYSTIQVEINQATFVGNTFSTEGSLYFFILEKKLIARDLTFDQNNGMNTTLFRGYNIFQIEKSKFTHNNLKGYFDLQKELLMKDIVIRDTACKEQCFIIYFNKGEFLRMYDVKISNASLKGEVMKVTGQLTVEIKNSEFRNIKCTEANIGNAFKFNPIENSKILIEKTLFMQMHGNMDFSAIGSTVKFVKDTFENVTSIKDNLMEMILGKTQVEFIRCEFIQKVGS